MAQYEESASGTLKRELEGLNAWAVGFIFLGSINDGDFGMLAFHRRDCCPCRR